MSYSNYMPHYNYYARYDDECAAAAYSEEGEEYSEDDEGYSEEEDEEEYWEEYEEEVPQPYCHTCNSWFSSFEALEDHRRNSPSHNWCKFCGTESATKEALCVHLMTHLLDSYTEEFERIRGPAQPVSIQQLSGPNQHRYLNSCVDAARNFRGPQAGGALEFNKTHPSFAGMGVVVPWHQQGYGLGHAQGHRTITRPSAPATTPPLARMKFVRGEVQGTGSTPASTPSGGAAAAAPLTDSVHGGPQVESMASFGSFESHTRGFGSKMLGKWGYKQGTGLGKQGVGVQCPLRAAKRPRLLGLGALAPPPPPPPVPQWALPPAPPASQPPAASFRDRYRWSRLPPHPGTSNTFDTSYFANRYYGAF